MRRSLTVAAAAVFFVASALSAAADGRSRLEAATWWGAGPISPLTTSGVDDDQLLVEGLAESESSWQAVAGVSYRLAGPVTEARLAFRVESATPGASLNACRITEAFTAETDAVPAYDCSQPVEGSLTEDQLVFAGLERFAAGTTLRVLVVPAGPGRTVLAKDSSLRTASPAPPPEEPVDVSPPPAPTTTTPTPTPAPPTTAAPAPGLAPGPRPGAPQTTTQPPTDTPAPLGREEPFAAGSSTTGFSPDDSSAGMVPTALFLAVALGAFTGIVHGAGTRLRPATVPWSRRSREP